MKQPTPNKSMHRPQHAAIDSTSTRRKPTPHSAYIQKLPRVDSPHLRTLPVASQARHRVVIELQGAQRCEREQGSMHSQPLQAVERQIQQSKARQPVQGSEARQLVVLEMQGLKVGQPGQRWQLCQPAVSSAEVRIPSAGVSLHVCMQRDLIKTVNPRYLS